eukprot:6458104-Amphidinium_carterae.1
MASACRSRQARHPTPSGCPQGLPQAAYTGSESLTTFTTREKLRWLCYVEGVHYVSSTKLHAQQRQDRDSLHHNTCVLWYEEALVGFPVTVGPQILSVCLNLVSLAQAFKASLHFRTAYGPSSRSASAHGPASWLSCVQCPLSSEPCQPVTTMLRLRLHNHMQASAHTQMLEVLAMLQPYH